MWKKIIFLCVLFFNTVCFGQIKTTKLGNYKQEIVFSIDNTYVYKETNTNIYTLRIYSTNQFEKNFVNIELGVGPDAAIETLENLNNLVKESSNGDMLILNDYECSITKQDGFGTAAGGIVFYPKFSAGIYKLECSVDWNTGQYNGDLYVYKIARKMYKKNKF